MPTVPLSLSALGFDILIALAQRPEGIGASELGRLVDGAPTSVQNNLRVLAAHGFVHRTATRYALIADAPGVEELVAAGLRLASPEAAMRLVVRANDTVEFACEDTGGFVIGERASPHGPSLEAMERSILTVRRGRPVATPPLLRFETEELARILHSAVGLRTRVGSAAVLKGVVRTPGRAVTTRYPDGHGRCSQNS